jgi:hypothetical protein
MKFPAFAALLHTLNVLVLVRSFTHNGANIQFVSSTGTNQRRTRCRVPPPLGMTIVSPFDSSEDAAATATATYTPLPSNDEPLELTWENVDMVLEEMRPYLLQDGGNVAISEIDGPVVRLELQVRLFINIANECNIHRPSMSLLHSLGMCVIIFSHCSCYFSTLRPNMKGSVRNMSQLHPNDENGPRAKA